MYAGSALALIGAGLFWRASFMPLPHVASKYGSDAIWALMGFVGFGFLLPRASTLVVALPALTSAWGVEFSQMYHAPWLNAVRTTIPGRRVLGNTFNWTDLPAYALGIARGALAECRLRKTARV